jgi:redox-sensitive bicupin YhaK (pirin superfamily)
MNGQPIEEPVIGHGPFVMNTPEEIKQAFVDFHHGKLGKIPHDEVAA